MRGFAWVRFNDVSSFDLYGNLNDITKEWIDFMSTILALTFPAMFRRLLRWDESSVRFELSWMFFWKMIDKNISKYLLFFSFIYAKNL